MRVECVSVSAGDLRSEHYAVGYTTESAFDQTLVAGKTYIVHGVSVWVHGLVHYLLDPSDSAAPVWYPAELFRVLDARVPASWRFWHRPDATFHVIAIIGYQELVEDTSHYDGLLERNGEALRVFWARRDEAQSIE